MRIDQILYFDMHICMDMVSVNFGVDVALSCQFYLRHQNVSRRSRVGFLRYSDRQIRWR